ncbi:sulfur carrier protein ThiS adenylyltransferase ThiF [Herbivorax sp. ANBcel31]|uniref:sulfur carrier protein ThiS adenylyltransferase ThiF n=1 Tax=Herbivorax sp. ANBcel31 TaxID=3069754 RepID=UPI0027AEF39D|nr:sulfur carrier protein ThiS adenylyltransferase ThiF [Herbivorax sp. ANBcel31]MDQ2085934.1 sulfur carrier protein ThiS adenylyltransferase ThiF [Herbivorax sp. ANBcel31]
MYNDFEKGLLGFIGEEQLKKLQNVKIAVAGAGGLGSNCAFNLVRSGFKKFKIVDFDVVEPSNLDRQFFFLDQINMPKVEALKENLKRINPDIEIEAVCKKVTGENIKELFCHFDVVVEAFDKVKYKKLIVENFLLSDKLLVCASGLAGWGNSDNIRIREVHDKFYMIGDFVTEVSENAPPISPKVNIAAAKQADVILSYFLKEGGV